MILNNAHITLIVNECRNVVNVSEWISNSKMTMQKQQSFQPNDDDDDRNNDDDNNNEENKKKKNTNKNQWKKYWKLSHK